MRVAKFSVFYRLVGVLQAFSHVLHCIEDSVKDQIEIHPQS